MLYLVVSLSIVEVPCRFFWLFKLRTQIAVAMARGKHSGKGKGQAAQQAQWLTRVDLYKFLPKWLLRSYPDGRGRPLFSAPSELTPSKIREVLDGDCSELLRRPVMGVNLCSASVDAAGLFLPKLMDLLPSVGQVLEKDALSEAVRYWNLSRDVERDSVTSQEKLKSYFRQVHKVMRDHHTAIAEAAEAAAALYLGLMALLELAAVTEDTRWWAGKVPERSKQSKRIQNWIKDPKDFEKLLAAMAHGIKEDAKKNKREHLFGELDQDSETSSALASQISADEDTSSAAVETRKSKRARVAEKSRKKRRQSSSDSSTAAAHKKSHRPKGRKTAQKARVSSESPVPISTGKMTSRKTDKKRAHAEKSQKGKASCSGSESRTPKKRVEKSQGKSMSRRSPGHLRGPCRSCKLLKHKHSSR